MSRLGEFAQAGDEEAGLGDYILRMTRLDIECGFAFADRLIEAETADAFRPQTQLGFGIGVREYFEDR